MRQSDPALVQTRVDDLYGQRYHLIMESNVKIRERIFSLIDQAFLMFDMLAIIAVVVASLGVVNTLTINVIERTREIGMLRATGMMRSQVIRMVMAEAALMGLVGGLLGIGLWRSSGAYFLVFDDCHVWLPARFCGAGSRHPDRYRHSPGYLTDRCLLPGSPGSTHEHPGGDPLRMMGFDPDGR